MLPLFRIHSRFGGLRGYETWSMFMHIFLLKNFKALFKSLKLGILFCRQFTLYFATMHGGPISRLWWISIIQTWQKSQERWDQYWSVKYRWWRLSRIGKSGFSQKEILSQKINPITSHQRTCFACIGNLGQKVSSRKKCFWYSNWTHKYHPRSSYDESPKCTFTGTQQITRNFFAVDSKDLLRLRRRESGSSFKFPPLGRLKYHSRCFFDLASQSQAFFVWHLRTFKGSFWSVDLVCRKGLLDLKLPK